MLKSLFKIIGFLLIVAIINYVVIKNINFEKIKYTDEVIKIKEDNYQYNEDYLMIMDIPKIKLFKEIYPVKNIYNNVDKGIEYLKSDLPNKENGNVLLASHRGTSKVAYFNDLDKLKKGDDINLYYKNKKYHYTLNNSYDILKTGYAKIIRNKAKNTLTMITCKKNDKNKQVVYVAYKV